MEDVVGEDGCCEAFTEECLLNTPIDIELIGVVSEAVVVAGGIVQIEHGLRGLADGEPVAEVYLELWLIKRHGSTIRLCIEILLIVTECQRGAVEAKLGRSSECCIVTLELVEVAAGPHRYLCPLLEQVTKG